LRKPPSIEGGFLIFNARANNFVKKKNNFGLPPFLQRRFWSP
jgi:hypothetical protein